MTNLSDKALVVRVSATAWTARRFDRQTTDELTDSHGASRNAARVNTYLLAGTDTELKAVNQAIRETRDFIEQNSVPWDTHGGRLVTPQAWVNMRGRVSELESQFATAVDAFVEAYPSAIARARINLSDLSSRIQYPALSEVRGLFSLRIVPEALPLSAPSDPRYGMTQAELDDLRTRIERTVNDRLDASLEAQWTRLRDEVARLNAAVIDRTSGRRTPIFETTVEKLRDTAQVLREMNVTENPHIDAICGQVLDALHGVGVDTLRSSASQRAEVQGATASILQRLEAFL